MQKTNTSIPNHRLRHVGNNSTKLSMDKNIKQNTGYKPDIKPVQKKNKNLQFRSVLMFLTIGIIMGWSINFVFVSKTPHKHSILNNLKENKTIKNHSVFREISEYDFINPYVQTSVYDAIYHQELSIFKHLIEEYCATAKKDKSISQISFYFRDLTNGQWFGVNEKEKFIPASLTKVPILIAVFQKAEQDTSYFNKRITYKGSFTETYLAQHPEIDDIRTTMKLNESYTVEELVNLMITKSDNEAALLLYEDFGMDHWNSLQKLLGNDVPIDAPVASNILTVKSYSSFFRILYNASLLSRENSEKALEILSRAEYNKGIRMAVPSNLRVCHKYGERDTLLSPTEIQIRQLHHAGIIYYPGKTFFICVMTKGSDKKKMENIIYDIAKMAYQQVDKQVKSFKKPILFNDIN